MRKMILTAAALAILSSTAFAQSSDKAGGSTGPAAQSGDNMAKGDMSKDKMSKKKMTRSEKMRKSHDRM